MSEKEKIELKKECLNQAIRVCSYNSFETNIVTEKETKSESILEVAKKFEEYLTSIS